MNVKLKSKIFEKFRYQADFAQSAGLREDRLSKIIHGRREAKEDEMKRIAKALRVKVNELFPTLESR